VYLPALHLAIVSVVLIKRRIEICRAACRIEEGTMQKTILGNENPDPGHLGDQWFGLNTIAGIAVTSEAEGALVESIFDSGSETEWRAGTSGLQVIRITFGEPKQSGGFYLSSRNRSSKGHRHSPSIRRPAEVNGPRLSDSNGSSAHTDRVKKWRITD
jgi:hypothetical protein